MDKKYIYDAFISYRHTELDKFVAEHLHKQLEAFKLPGKIAKKKNGRTKIERVFRDKDELPLTNNLEDPILKALESSEYLIVICSPRLRESLWCKKEIETFIKLHGREKVLAVLIEGEPDESFPEELLYAEEIIKHPDGTEEVIKKPMEPLAADVRGKNKKEMLKAMRTEMLRLLAPMFSLTYDDLRQRHRERRMKRILTAVCAGAAVCLAFGTVSTTMALRIQKQKEQIESQNAEIQAQNAEIQAQNEEIQNQNQMLAENQAIVLAEESGRLLDAGNRIGAIDTAVTALTQYEGVTMPYTAEAQYALTQSLRPYDINNSIKAKYQLETAGTVDFMKVSPDGNKLLTGDSSGAVILWDLVTGTQVCALSAPEAEKELMCEEYGCAFVGENYIACVDKDYHAHIYSILSENETVSEVEYLTTLEGETEKIYADEEGRYFVRVAGEKFFVYGGDTLEYLVEYTLEENTAFSNKFFFDEEGTYIGFGEDLIDPENRYSMEKETRIRFLNILQGTCSPAINIGWSYIEDICFADGRAYVLYAEASKDLSYHMTRVFACSPEDATRYWTNQYEGERGLRLIRSYAEGVSRLVMVTSYNAYAMEREDGSPHVMTSIGNSIVGSAVYMNKDMYILFTRDGEYLLTDGETMTAYNLGGLFQCHSDNVEEFLVAGRSFVIREHGENKITYYQYSVGSEVVPYEGEYTEPEETWAMATEAVAVAQEYDIPKAEQAYYAFFNEDNSLLGVSYTDHSFEIYSTADKQCITSVDKLSGSVCRFVGTDANGNIYVAGITYGYMFNPDGEMLAELEGLTEVDAENNMFILEDSSDRLFTVPIYTVEELLAKAEAFVLR